MFRHSSQSPHCFHASKTQLELGYLVCTNCCKLLGCFPFNFLQAVPPLEITDLIEEVRDGHVLLSLLEVLLGTTLVSPSS